MKELKELLEKDEINSEELTGLLCARQKGDANFLLIDVREEYEYNNKKIVGTDHLIPLSDFFNNVKKIEEEKNSYIIATCKLGGRSAQAQAQLRALGFNNVINLSGGITKYKGEVS